MIAYDYLDNKAIKSANVYTVNLHTVPWNSLIGGHLIKEEIYQAPELCLISLIFKEDFELPCCEKNCTPWVLCREEHYILEKLFWW